MENTYKNRTNKAFELHKNNLTNEAETIYKELLSENPNDVNILNLYGMLLIAQNDYKSAIDVLSRAVVLNPLPEIIVNLGKAYFYNKEYENAVNLLKSANEIKPSDDIYYSLGRVYNEISNFDEAIICYEKAFKLNPKNANNLYNLSLAYKEKGNLKKSLKFALLAEKYNCNDEAVSGLIYSIYDDLKNYKQALLYLKKLILINPKNHVYHYNSGVLSAEIGEIENAINFYTTTISLNPKYTAAYANLACIYEEKDLNKAFSFAQKAYEINKNEIKTILLNARILRKMYKNKASIDFLKVAEKNGIKAADLYFELALNYMDTLNYKTALEYYEKSIEKNPKELRYLHGKATALKYLGKTEEFVSLLEKIVKKDKTQIQSAISLGMAYLTQKDFQKGMTLYIKRSLETGFSKLFKKKIWKHGSPLNAKNVLVYCDCGLGDTIMFLRYLPELNKIAKEVVLQTDFELVKLLQISFPNIKIISKNETYSDYDYVIPLMNIPYALNIDFNNIPSSALKVFYSDVEKFKNCEIFNNQNKKIGIFYSGNKKILKNRSIKFDEISKLFDKENCTFYSFQTGKINDVHENLINLSDKISDYYDTACLLKCMDCVVTIDSSIVHASGSLGVKTYLLLPFVPEWRWFDDKDSTIWYNSVKIFKQELSNNWNNVLTRVKEEL